MAENSSLSLPNRGPLAQVAALGARITGLAERIPYSAVALLARFAVASVFWRSARTKVDGLTITPNTHFLFAEEY